MTITLQAVNDLIASLESAGELSIREQKFLKLAKAFKQMAAENVALKAAVPEPRNVEFDNDSLDDVSLAEDFGFNDAIGKMKINMCKTPPPMPTWPGLRLMGWSQELKPS